MDELALYVSDLAPHFLSAELAALRPFFESRAAVGRAMEELARSFRTAFPMSRLTLYAPRSSGESTPRGLYWGILERPKLAWERPLRGARRARPWTRHKGKRLTPSIARKAGEGSRWEKYRSFEPRVKKLQAAHDGVWRALKRVRNVLAFYGGPAEEGEILLKLPSLPCSETAFIPGDVLLHTWRVVIRLLNLNAKATNLVRFYNAAPPAPLIRFRFAKDRDHPFGRFLWSRAALGSQSRPITDRELRILQVPRSARRDLLAFGRQARELEKERRRLMAVLRGNRQTLLGNGLAARKLLEEFWGLHGVNSTTTDVGHGEAPVAGRVA